MTILLYLLTPGYPDSTSPSGPPRRATRSPSLNRPAPWWWNPPSSPSCLLLASQEVSDRSFSVFLPVRKSATGVPPPLLASQEVSDRSFLLLLASQEVSDRSLFSPVKKSATGPEHQLSAIGKPRNHAACHQIILPCSSRAREELVNFWSTCPDTSSPALGTVPSSRVFYARAKELLSRYKVEYSCAEGLLVQRLYHRMSFIFRPGPRKVDKSDEG